MQIQKADTVYTILREVSRTGMTRYIDAYIIRDNEPVCVSHEIANALNRKLAPAYYPRWNTKTGIKCEGCGMDMGFELVYSYSQLVFKDGYCLKQQWL